MCIANTGGYNHFPESCIFINFQDTALPPQDTVLPPQETVLPPQDTVLPPQDTVFSPQDTTLLHKYTVLPPQDTVLPHQETVLPRQGTALPPLAVAFPTTLDEMTNHTARELIAEVSQDRDLSRLFIVSVMGTILL